MKKLMIVANWEFFRHVRSKSFLLATFVSPIIFALFIYIPLLLLGSGNKAQPVMLGCVSFDSSSDCDQLIAQLEKIQKKNRMPEIILIKIKTDTTEQLAKNIREVAFLGQRLDSLNMAYTKIKERRKFIFQRPKSHTRTLLLKNTYDQLQQTREERDLADIIYQRKKSRTDSLLRSEIRHHADSLLTTGFIDGYILITPQLFSNGTVEFYSQAPARVLPVGILKIVLQTRVVEQRLQDDGIDDSKIEEWLKPLNFREYQIDAFRETENNFLLSYLAPVVAVLFLFISIFTSSGFLFSGILREKSNRIIEILVSSCSSLQLMGGKIIGLGLLGLAQVAIWMAITIGLLKFDLLPNAGLEYLNWQNAGIFAVYFVLGYLFFAAIYVGFGSLFSSEEDAHHLTQLLRLTAIFPVALAVLVLEAPRSLVVRVLSYIPFLTPTFMILRTPVERPSEMEYGITMAIMVVSIALAIFTAAKLFRIGSLLYGKKPGVREIWGLLKS